MLGRVVSSGHAILGARASHPHWRPEIDQPDLRRTSPEGKTEWSLTCVPVAGTTKHAIGALGVTVLRTGEEESVRRREIGNHSTPFCYGKRWGRQYNPFPNYACIPLSLPPQT